MKKVIKLIFTIILTISFSSNIEALTKAPIDITSMSIPELTAALDEGIISSEQLVNIYLERIEAYDYSYNSINQINKNAVEEAKELDKQRKEGNIKGKLHGIPIVVKTNIDVEGLATTAGAKALSDNYPKEDADIIKKLKENGAIILASTNMSEFAFLTATSTSSYGSVKNAYSTKHSSYGSSGGTATAVALSFAAAGLGTDTNSSIRVPASASNLFGFRSSYGTLDMDGILPYDIYRDVVGPMTKTAIDSALIMDIISDNTQTSKYETATKNTSLKGMKIGVIKEFYNGSSSASLRVNGKTYKGIVSLMDEQIKKMEEAGAKIVYIEDFMNSTYYNIVFNTMSGFSFCDGFNKYIKNTNSKITNFKKLSKASGKIYSISGYTSSCGKSESKHSSTIQARKKKYLYYVGEVMEKNNVDVLLYPSTKSELQKMSEANEWSLSTPSTYISSTTGLPAVTVPMGFYEKLPYGMEFLAGPNQEELLYKVISAYENLNKFVTLPSAAPSLYETDENVFKLIEEYKILKEKEISKFIKEEKEDLLNRIKIYFEEYSNKEMEEIISEAKELKTEIDELYKKNETIIKIESNIKYVIIGFIIFILLIIIIKKIKKRKRRKLRRKER